MDGRVGARAGAQVSGRTGRRASERAGGRAAVSAFTFHSEARGGGRKTVPAKQQAARGCSWRRTNGGHRIRRAGGEQEDSSVGWAADGRKTRGELHADKSGKNKMVGQMALGCITGVTYLS